MSTVTAAERRARDRDRSAAWWEQRLALGICAACRHPLPQDATFALHPICGRLNKRGVRFRVLRAMSPGEIEALYRRQERR